MASDPTSDRAERLQASRVNDPGTHTQPLASPAPRHHVGLKLIAVFRGDPGNRYFHALLVRIANLDPRTLKAVSAGSFFYSALLLTEGIGLWFEKCWAEYLTVIATASFIPLEIYELAKRTTEVKLLVLAINLAILLYLIRTLRLERKSKH